MLALPRNSRMVTRGTSEVKKKIKKISRFVDTLHSASRHLNANFNKLSSYGNHHLRRELFGGQTPLRVPQLQAVPRIGNLSKTVRDADAFLRRGLAA